MGVYVDAEDLRQHLRQAGSLDDETVEEIMGEQEDYVRERLGIGELPPNNNIIKSIVRDLTVAGAIFSMPAAPPDQINKATLQRSEALRRLNELMEEGFKAGTSGNKADREDVEIYNPYPESFFQAEQFGL